MSHIPCLSPKRNSNFVIPFLFVFRIHKFPLRIVCVCRRTHTHTVCGTCLYHFTISILRFIVDVMSIVTHKLNSGMIHTYSADFGEPKTDFICYALSDLSVKFVWWSRTSPQKQPPSIRIKPHIFIRLIDFSVI